MKRKGFTLIEPLVVIAVIVGYLPAACAAPTVGDLYSVVSGPIEDPDIAWAPRIPFVGQRVSVCARIRAEGHHPVEVRFVVTGPDTHIVRSGRPLTHADPNGQYVEYRTHWQANQPGFYTLTVQVDPNHRTSDTCCQNNTSSVLIPVTWQELHIICWGPRRDCQWVGTGMPAGMSGKLDDPSPEEVAYWHRRGTKVLGYMYTIERDLMQLSETEMIEHIVRSAGKFTALDCDGLIIDETGSYPTPEGLEFIRRFGEAYNQVRQRYPHMRVYNWIAGGLMDPELNIARRNGHVLMGETYEAIHGREGPVFPEFVAQRVSRLRLVGGIIALGVGGDCGFPDPAIVENSVRLCRRLGPELPGICYYSAAFPAQSLDRITFDYFIKPVVTIAAEDLIVREQPPAVGQTAHVVVKVHNIGGMPAQNVGVSLYARDLTTGQRTVLAQQTIAQLGNGPQGSVEVAAPWPAAHAGQYQVEAELRPSADYTILDGFACRSVPESAAGSPSAPTVTVTGNTLSGLIFSAPADSSAPTVTVRDYDVFLSSYAPCCGNPVAVQVRVHNVGKTPAQNVGLRIYARRMADDQRTLVSEAFIPQIGNGWKDIPDENPASILWKVIDGTKHQIAHWGSTSRVMFNRALVDAWWTPTQPGYYTLQAEIQPAPQYSICGSPGEVIVPVVLPSGSEE